MTNAVDALVFRDQHTVLHTCVDLSAGEAGREQLVSIDQSLPQIGPQTDRFVDLTAHCKSKQQSDGIRPPGEARTPAPRGGSAPPKRAASARPRQLPLYDVADELHDRAVARNADEAAIVGVHPVAEVSLGGQRVELRTLDRHVDAGVARRVLRDLRA